jgi:hypothetical protein
MSVTARIWFGAGLVFGGLCAALWDAAPGHAWTLGVMGMAYMVVSACERKPR